jgi:hypothetical protein
MRHHLTALWQVHPQAQGDNNARRSDQVTATAAAKTAAKPAIKMTAAVTKTTKPAAKVTSPEPKPAAPKVTKSVVPPQVVERINGLWTTEPERRFAVKAWKHAIGIRKSQGTPHGLSKEQAAAIVARVADLTR